MNCRSVDIKVSFQICINQDEKLKSLIIKNDLDKKLVEVTGDQIAERLIVVIIAQAAQSEIVFGVIIIIVVEVKIS
jgi:hypothetical protein